MTGWICNTSRDSIQKGTHIKPGPNCMLIQISDPPGNHPKPKYQFSEVHQFDFLDIEHDGMTNFGDGEMVDASEFAITQEQADQLVDLLQHALKNNMNVLVHCHAGICRSGAVCEVGVMLGFVDTGARRQPNILVKTRMMKRLGWTYE